MSLIDFQGKSITPVFYRLAETHVFSILPFECNSGIIYVVF